MLGRRKDRNIRDKMKTYSPEFELGALRTYHVFLHATSVAVRSRLWSSVIELLPSMSTALDSVPSIASKQKDPKFKKNLFTCLGRGRNVPDQPRT
jgi:hypothetical protein